MDGSWIAQIETIVDLRFVAGGLVLALLGPLLARGPYFGMTSVFLWDGVPLGRRGQIWAAVSFELVAAALVGESFWELFPLHSDPHQGPPVLQHIPPWPVILLFVVAVGNFVIFLNWAGLYALYVRSRR